VGYIEKPINSESNMMALAAKDAAFTSDPHPQGPPLTPDNIVVQEFLGNLHLNNIVYPPPKHSTSYSIASCVANPMVIDGDMQHHHDDRQLVDMCRTFPCNQQRQQN